MNLLDEYDTMIHKKEIFCHGTFPDCPKNCNATYAYLCPSEIVPKNGNSDTRAADNNESRSESIPSGIRLKRPLPRGWPPTMKEQIEEYKASLPPTTQKISIIQRLSRWIDRMYANRQSRGDNDEL